MRDVSFGTALWLNLPGLDADLTPDLAHFDFDAFLATLAGADDDRCAPHRRHGRPADRRRRRAAAAPDDGLPVSLTPSSRATATATSSSSSAATSRPTSRGSRHRAGARSARPTIASRSTATSNSPTSPTLAAFVDALRARAAACARSSRRIALSSSSRCRARSPLDTDVHDVARRCRCIIDESDATLDAFVAGARARLRRRVEQELQGLLQIAAQRRALRALECRAGTARCVHDRRGPDRAGRARRAAGSRACRAARPYARRAQRPSLRRGLRGPARERCASSRRFSPRIRTFTRRHGDQVRARDPRRPASRIASLAIARLRIGAWPDVETLTARCATTRDGREFRQSIGNPSA